MISVSGLRGVVGESLTPEVAMRYASAFAMELAEGPILVTRDGRASGEMFLDNILRALRALGREVVDGEIAATPTTGVYVRQLQCAGGIQVTASHNPAEYNGLKLFSSEGRVISEDTGKRVLQRFRSWPEIAADGDQTLAHGAKLTSQDAHRELVFATIDLERIRAQNYKVLLDCNHGAGSRLGEPMLQQMGCQTFVLGSVPDGQFEHPPEPTLENLSEVSQRVLANGVDIGFCQDPDADRLGVIDENGRYVGEEYTLALCLNHILQDRQGPIVTNCSSSRMSEDLAQHYGVECFRSKVGEVNVADEMIRRNAVYGGEGNGGPIDPRVGYVRDSFVGMAQILDAMALRKCSVGQLVDELPRYHIHKIKISVACDRVPILLDQLERQFNDATPDRLDGLRLYWQDKWILIRASNTEPIVRVVAEALTIDEAKRLCITAQQAARQSEP